MNEMRPSAVAGAFYPGHAGELADTVDGFLEDAGQFEEGPASQAVPKAIIVPHAGYVYSGPVAAKAYRKLAALKGRVRRVVLIGPAHFVAFDGMALPRWQAFRTPLGDLPLDHPAICAVEEVAGVVRANRPHGPEHSLEVQLPFLQRCLGEVAIVPIVVGRMEADRVADLLHSLWGGEDTLIVVSSDLSHYRPYDEARRLDQATAEAIETFDRDKLGPERACGFCPVAGLLEVARRRNLAIERLDLRNSGDTAGPRDRVVGYGAWALWETGRGPR